MTAPPDAATASWSDHLTDNSFSSWVQSQSLVGTDLGIAIPAVLQPLLGLDFVPYLPTPTNAKEETVSREEARLTDADLEDMNLMVSSNEPVADADGKDSGRNSESKVSTERPFPPPGYLSLQTTRENLHILDESGQTPTTGESSQESPSASKIPPKRSWRPRSRLISKVKGKLEGRGKNKNEVQRRRTSSWTGGDGKLPPSNDSSTTKSTTPRQDSSLEWIREQHLLLANHQANLQEVHSEAMAMQARAKEIENRVSQTQSEISNLQKALSLAEQRLRQDLDDFGRAKSKLSRLEAAALKAQQAVLTSIQKMQRHRSASSSFCTDNSDNSHPSDVIELDVDGTFVGTCPDQPLQISSQVPLRRRASTAPPAVRVESFMRVHDLNIINSDNAVSIENHKTSSHSSLDALSDYSDTQNLQQQYQQNGDFMYVGSNIAPILRNLTHLGYQLSIDESKRFVPTRDTERLLLKYRSGHHDDNVLGDWPIGDWKLAHGTDILVWVGETGGTGFGSDWPVVKARGLVNTSPKTLAKFMMDSSRIKEYNKMSAGREDVLRIQHGLDTTAEESCYGFPGDCKVVRALNRPRFLPKTIETMSLMYTRPLATSSGSYITVIRSVFEDDSGEHKSPSANTIRSEMLLGVLLFRPANKDHSVCEFTTITHVYSPGVPEMVARRVAPSSAYNMMKDIQAVFQKK